MKIGKGKILIVFAPFLLLLAINTQVLAATTVTPASSNATPTVSLSADTKTIFEAGGVASITATVSAASSKIVTVGLIKGGTATDGVDYTLSSTTITIPAGEIQGSVTLTALNDTVSDFGETVQLTMSSVTNAKKSSITRQTIKILDDNNAPVLITTIPVVTLKVDSNTVLEGGTALFTVALSGTSNQTITVTMGRSGTARLITDYSLTTTRITIPSGSSAGSFTLKTIDDSLFEEDETVVMQILRVVGATQGSELSQTITINDNDPEPTIIFSTRSNQIFEKGGSTMITATLSSKSTRTMTVNLSMEGGTADETDYRLSRTVFKIPPGKTQDSIRVITKNDLLNEDDETIMLSIATVDCALCDDPPQTVTIKIIDDDKTPTVKLLVSRTTNLLLPERDGKMLGQIHLSGRSSFDIEVALELTGTATQGEDYTITNQAVGSIISSGRPAIVIPKGQTQAVFSLDTIDDTMDEDEETVVIAIDKIIANRAVELGVQKKAIIIQDDDDPPTVSLSVDGGVTHISENGGVATIRAILSAVSGKNVSVTVAKSGSAESSESTLSDTTMTLPAGSASGSVVMTAMDDLLYENVDPTVILKIPSVTNATKSGEPIITMTLKNDDPPPTVTLSVGSNSMDETGGEISVVATLDTRSAIDAIVTLDTGGPATDLLDYRLSNTKIIIPAGSLSASVSLAALLDALNEEDEEVVIDIANCGDCTGSEVQQQTVTITIIDDDPIPPITPSGQNPQRLQGITAIAAGGGHTCALLTENTVNAGSSGATVSCWGRNFSGQIGDGTTDNRSPPVLVEGIITATAIATGSEHTCALLEDQTIMCWGGNFSGQIGDGTTNNHASPVLVEGITTATAIATGGGHTCALLEDRTVICWGFNPDGQIEDETTFKRLTPVIIHGITTATAIVAGSNHTCVLLADSTVNCWGDNLYGQIGDGTEISRSTPVLVSGIANAKAISASADHTCALLSDGKMKCWGNNSSGQIGDGTEINRLIPVSVAGVNTATAITTGYSHTCALLLEGAIECWGYNNSGQLGDGTDINRLTPTPVFGMTAAMALAAGWIHTCALLSDSTMKCWGSNLFGELGNPEGLGSFVPVPIDVLAPSLEPPVSGTFETTLRLYNSKGEETTVFPEGEPITFVLTVRNLTDAPQQITLPCSRLTDFLVLSVGGQVLAQESHNTFCLTGITELDFVPNEEKVFTSVWDQNDNDGFSVGEGYFLAQGFVSTREERFSGTRSPLLAFTIIDGRPTIGVTPEFRSILVGETQPFNATRFFSDGNSEDITPFVLWNSSNPEVATISPSGLVTGISLGTTLITATDKETGDRGETALDIRIDPSLFGKNISNSDRGQYGFDSTVATSGSTVIVAWSNSTTIGNREIFLSRSTDFGVTFGPSINISNDRSGSHQPSIVIEGATVIVVWVDYPYVDYTYNDRVGTTNILLARSTDFGVTFATPVNIGDLNIGSRWNPSVAISGSTVIAAWDNYTWDNENIQHKDIVMARSTDGGVNFDAPVNITQNTEAHSFYPSVAISGSVIIIAWHHYPGDYTKLNIFLSRSTDFGASFTDPVNLTNDPDFFFSYPSVGMSGSTVIIAYNRSNDTGSHGLYLSRSTNGGEQFDTPMKLSDGTGISWLPSVAISGSAVMTTWEYFESDDIHHILTAPSTDGGVTFGPPHSLFRSIGSLSPSTVISGSMAITVWENNTSERSDIFLIQTPISTDFSIP